MLGSGNKDIICDIQFFIEFDFSPPFSFKALKILVLKLILAEINIKNNI